MLHRSFLLPVIAAMLASCAVLEDDGTRLAFAIERGARTLATSDGDELVVVFEPHGGVRQDYEVRLTRSHSTEVPYKGSVVVNSNDPGGTSHQGRYVYIERPMRVVKRDAATSVTLRKVSGRIDVVALD